MQNLSMLEVISTQLKMIKRSLKIFPFFDHLCYLHYEQTVQLCLFLMPAVKYFRGRTLSLPSNGIIAVFFWAFPPLQQSWQHVFQAFCLNQFQLYSKQNQPGCYKHTVVHQLLPAHLRVCAGTDLCHQTLFKHTYGLEVMFVFHLYRYDQLFSVFVCHKTENVSCAITQANVMPTK